MENSKKIELSELITTKLKQADEWFVNKEFSHAFIIGYLEELLITVRDEIDNS